MAELDIDTALEWRGRTVVDRDGEKVGTLRDIYLDEDERPHWGSVATGLFGRSETLVPLGAATPAEDALELPFTGEQVKGAPHVDPDVQLTPEEEAELYRHYELEDDEPPPKDEPPPDEPSTDDAMIRSEEEVSVSKQARPRERVRLKKYIVTDYVKKTVPVQREKVALEHDPPEDDAR